MSEKNIKNVPLRLPVELHTAFKIKVAKDYTNMNSKLIDLILEYLNNEVHR